jgi:hypothetical protein
MPPASHCLARATKLVKVYIQHHKAHKKCLAHHTAFLKHQLTQENLHVSFTPDPFSELSEADHDSNISSSNSSSSGCSSMWSSSVLWMSETSNSDLGLNSDSEGGLLNLLAHGDDGWDSDEDSDDSGISDWGADDEESDGEEEAVRSPL